MATLDELLSADTSAAYEDVNDIILVDPVTRLLLVPATEVILGVESDEKAEYKYFRCPKIVGCGVDVTACTIHVHYQNANGEPGRYRVTELAIDENDVIFAWKLTRDVTRYRGTVKFNLCFCGDADNHSAPAWHTTYATGKVLEGLEVLEKTDV